MSWSVIDVQAYGEGPRPPPAAARLTSPLGSPSNTLRELERPLAYKRQVKQRLSQRDRRQGRRIGLWTQLTSSLHYKLVQVGYRRGSNVFPMAGCWLWLWLLQLCSSTGASGPTHVPECDFRA